MPPRPAAADRHAAGAAGEAIARKHLEAAGLRWLASNARFRHGEIDLVMRDRDAVVFVEVRYRRGDGYGGSVASVDAGKQRKLVRAAQSFLAAHPALAAAPCRFDVIAIDGDASAPRVDWIRNAFEAG